MIAQPAENRVLDPCTQIQIDLSAMLDGELDAGSVLRVMMHSDACASCRAFLDGVRLQVRSHRQLHAVLVGEPDQFIEVPGRGPNGTVRVAVAELRQHLTQNREQLARIFYEVGRGFVLLGLSPTFSRVVARDPASIADMFQRGRNLLDEVERMTSEIDPEAVGSEWLKARQLFGETWVRSPQENLAKGTELLREALLLAPEMNEARIYLGHAHHVAGDRAAACREFRDVLERSDDVGTRGFALLNLGNVHLESEEFADAERAFLELVGSGAVGSSPHLGLTYFNLALACGMQGRFDDCVAWLGRLYSELPHKRRMIAEELRDRVDFVECLARDPRVYDRLAHDFPIWFPKREAC